MARQVQVVIDVETARAVANFAKVAVASQKMGNTSVEAARRTTTHFDRVGSAVSVVTRNLVGMAAGAASFGKLISAAEQYEAHLDRLSVKSNELAKSTIALAALQKPEMSRDAVKQAVLTGSRYGMNTAESTATVQLLQSLNNGDLKKALQESKTAFRLSQLGVDQASIQTIATQSYAKNVELAKMGGAFYAAAEISPLEIADIAKAAPAIVSYKDPMTGVAAIPAMAAGGVPVAQLQDATKDLGMALALPSDLVDRATADLKPMGYNYQELTEIEQLKVLRQRIPDLDRSGDLSIPEVMKAGITEQQKARSLAIGINQLDTLMKAREAAEYVPADALDRTVERIRRENPELNAAMLTDEASALREYYTLYGPESAKARNFAARQQDKGLQLIDKGYGALVDDETGKPGYVGRAFGPVLGVESTQEEIDRGAAMWSGMSLPGSMPYPVRPKESYEVVSSIDRLTSTLDRNTAALENGNAVPAGAKISGPKVEGSFAVGIKRVPHDMVAEIHKDEAVVPAYLNPDNPASAHNKRFPDDVRDGLDIQARILGMNPDKASMYRAMGANNLPGGQFDSVQFDSSQFLASLPPLPQKPIPGDVQDSLDIEARILGVNPEKLSKVRQMFREMTADPVVQPERLHKNAYVSPRGTGISADGTVPAIEYAPRGVYRRGHGQNANWNAWHRNPEAPFENANSRVWSGIDTESEYSGFNTWPQQEGNGGGGWRVAEGGDKRLEVPGLAELSDRIQELDLSTQRLNQNVQALSGTMGSLSANGSKPPMPVSRGRQRGE